MLLADRSLIGRGGATVMAQMTVAVALGEETPDHWSTICTTRSRPGAGCATRALARLLCEEGPDCIREMDAWGVGWARRDGHITQAMAPGHDRPRCAYVDFLNTGPAVSKTLRTVVNKTAGIRKAGDLLIIDLVRVDGEVAGAVALHLASGNAVTIAAKATIVATGGLTRLYRRNSASANMGGDGYALALRAGASLIDMEFVQFFPIGHLAPRLIGMDPIMWDPFRYKLGGRLLNGLGQEFASRYGSNEDGSYVLDPRSRDLRHHQGGRGRPRLAARRRLSELRALLGGGAARGVRAGDRPPRGEPHRSHQDAGRGGADRALPHGRHRRGHADGDRRAGPVRGRRSGRRRERRQPAVRQCGHRGAGVRPPRRRSAAAQRAPARRSRSASTSRGTPSRSRPPTARPAATSPIRPI